MIRISNNNTIWKEKYTFCSVTLAALFFLLFIDLNYENLFNNNENSSNVISNPVNSTQSQNLEINNMKISIKVNEKILTASMIDCKATTDFISLLTLQLTLEDYTGTEKVSQLPKKLSTEESPAGSDPSIGDITYYAPWGNLAIFYKDFGYANGLIILGTIDNGPDAFNVNGSLNVTIDLIT